MHKQKMKDGSTVLTAGFTLKEIMAAVYPVGSIYMSVSPTNPGAALGGTWVAWGSGRVPVGVDAGQTEFDTVEETGGAKTHVLTAIEMPIHNHTIDHNHGSFNSGSTAVDALFSATDAATNPASASTIDRGSSGDSITNPISGSSHVHSVNVPNYAGNSGLAGNGGAHNNLQPYITCYMWKRTV